MTTAPSVECREPRGGPTLKVARVARASIDKHTHQSLDHQLSTIEAYVKRHHSGEVEFIDFASQGTGGHLGRAQLVELKRQIKGRSVDLVVCEDLSRICRRGLAYEFCQMCMDFDTRLIAINDGIDTATTGGRIAVVLATWHR